MAYKRSITARAKLFYQQQHRIAPSFSHIHRDASDREESQRTTPASRNAGIPNILPHSFFANGNNFSSFNRSRDLLRERRFAFTTGCGPVFTRNYSAGTSGEEVYDWTNELMDKSAKLTPVLNEVVQDRSAELAPVLNEVVVAAADSFFPVAMLQCFIDFVHRSTGFDWWAAIMLTTIFIRTLQIPVMIYQLKSTSKFTLLRPKLEAVKEEMNKKGMDPKAVAEGQVEMKKLFKEYGVTPFTPLKGLLISGPISCSFFFAVRNMAEKVPSFKDGGMLWFTDLMTPDSMYIFPILTALTFWITVELNAQEGLEGNPTAGTIKKVSRIFAALTVPLTASFPKAIFCYWITSNLFSLTYGMVMKRPDVKKLFDIPIIPVTPPSPTSANQKPALSFWESLTKYAEAQKYAHQQQEKSLPSPATQQMSQSSPTSANQKPALSFWQSLKKYAEAQKYAYQQQQKSLSSPPQQVSLSPPAEISSSKPSNKKISSTSVLQQRIKSLEKKVKEGKKGKRKA